MPSSTEAALPYHEPGIVTILILTSFIVLLNLANHLVDRVLYCGLLAQILLGIAWGTPGTNWLGKDFEHAVVNLGYLGLLLIVYEGGLLTSFRALKDNLSLSMGVAITGIGVPIGLSYVLLSLVGATPLQAFAAGASLCSTSLGTTFSVLSASNLTTTRMGTVLTSAAMMDDVVGLVMVQVISNLGTGSITFTATDVVRPALVSLAFVIIIPLTARFLARPTTLWLNNERENAPRGPFERLLGHSAAPLILHTALLIGLVTAAVYAGTSGLFAAYLAGASISWWDTEVPHLFQTKVSNTSTSGHDTSGQGFLSVTSTTPDRHPHATQKIAYRRTGAGVFESIYAPALKRILKPFFFASIGFSVPITLMFKGEVVWKGIIYTMLMVVGKFVCGFWLMRLPGLSSRVVPISNSKLQTTTHTEKKWSTETPSDQSSAQVSADPSLVSPGPEALSLTDESNALPQSNIGRSLSKHRGAKSKKQKTPTQTTPKPLSLYPSCILGSAMVARGEIGFLISAIAESNAIYGSEPNGPIFLVVTWAIMLCTFLGPLLVGILVRRVKRLEGGSKSGKGEVLGIWGGS